MSTSIAIGELEPCPFCGSDGEEVALSGHRRASGHNDGWNVRCYVCHVETAYEDTPAAATAAWNRRALSSPQVNGEVVEDVARAAYRAGYQDGYVDGAHPEGVEDEAEVHRQIDNVAMEDGWANNRDHLLAALSKAEAHVEGEAAEAERPCTCPPGERPEPCARGYALTVCHARAAQQQTDRQTIAALSRSLPSKEEVALLIQERVLNCGNREAYGLAPGCAEAAEAILSLFSGGKGT